MALHIQAGIPSVGGVALDADLPAALEKIGLVKSGCVMSVVGELIVVEK